MRTSSRSRALLGSDEVRELFTDDQIRDLVLWHALEEAEHRAVAFDVYQAVGGPHWLRAWTLRVAVVTTGLDIASGTITSMLFDPEARDLRAVWRSLRGLRHTPFASLGLGRSLVDYTHRDFHPSDHGSKDLVDNWSERLFAETDLDLS